MSSSTTKTIGLVVSVVMSFSFFPADVAGKDMRATQAPASRQRVIGPLPTALTYRSLERVILRSTHARRFPCPSPGRASVGAGNAELRSRYGLPPPSTEGRPVDPVHDDSSRGGGGIRTRRAHPRPRRGPPS